MGLATRLQVHNLTADSIQLQWNSGSGAQGKVLALSSTTTTTLVDRQKHLQVSLSISPEKGKEDVASQSVASFRLKLRSKLKVPSIPDPTPFRVYTQKIDKLSTKMIITPKRNPASFLSEMPDTLPLSALLLPGTHETMAFSGWPISQCQDTSLLGQLQAGIRVLDIRLGGSNGELVAFHGIINEKTPFKDMVKDICTFLTTPVSSSETIVMSLKQEDFPKTSGPDFSQMVHTALMNAPAGKDIWYMQNRVPRLGEVRGKVVLMCRFTAGPEWEGGYENAGIHPTNWPDSPNTIFTWQVKDTLVRQQDWYNIGTFLSIPEKVSLACSVLQPPDTPNLTLGFTFLSASSFPLALPPTIAKGAGFPGVNLGFEGVNSRVVKWLLDQLSPDVVATPASADSTSKAPAAAAVADPRLRGWMMIDFFSEPDPNLVPLLIECNYRGRRQGEEGWPKKGFFMSVPFL